MANRRIEMYEYRQIIYRLQQGQKVRTMAREGLANREKIRAIKKVAQENGWLAKDVILPDEKTLLDFFGKKLTKTQSKVIQHAEVVNLWVKQGIRATVISQHLKEVYGFEGTYSSVLRFVQKIKGKHPQLTVPLHFQPGEAGQVDFGKGPKLFDERTGCEEETWFFVFTLCWSRHQYAEFITHQDVATWLNCHQNAFNWFGGVVDKVIIDNPKCAITKACYYEPTVQRSYEAFAQDYKFIISACPAREPKKKGRVESGVKYLKGSFLPLRKFKSIQDANQQLKNWILNTAGVRIHGSTFEKPLKMFTDIEIHQLKPLPKTPPEIAVWEKVHSYKNCHVLYQKCYYSVPYTLYGKDLWLKATKNIITIYHHQEIISMHSRLYKAGAYNTKIEHLPPNAKAFLLQDKDWCLEQSHLVGKSTVQVVNSLLQHPTQDLLRAAQGIIKLGRKYGTSRLEMACKRAIHFNAITYHSVKNILINGLDYHTIDENNAFEKLGAVYKGQGFFQRQIFESIH